MKTRASLSPTMYVVDDDASIRESISSLIRAEGMLVEVFASPLDFLALERLKEFSCVVLDVRMPGFDGLALQEELARRGWDPPIIFITGHGDGTPFFGDVSHDCQQDEPLVESRERQRGLCKERSPVTPYVRSGRE